MCQLLESGRMVAAATIAAVMIFHCGVAEAATYTIQWHEKPDLRGVTGKMLRAGDTIVFAYADKMSYNTIKVDKDSYNRCNFGGWPVGHSGNDQFTLAKGWQYFICGAGGHCQNNGMKVAIEAK